VVVESLDERFMRRALLHAARGAGRTTPNPMVGAVIVSSDGVIVGQGWHERAGEPHAEVHALAAAGSASSGATMYVTLEPCCHTGRTGPCTRALIAGGIRRVVTAMVDPDPRVAGKGVAELRAAGVDVRVGVCESEARRLNHAFITVKQQARPLVILKSAATMDACVAAAPGQRTAISSRDANVQSHLVRAAVDAIAVGSETMLVDDPLLTARVCVRVRPLVRVVFDRRLRTPPDARIFSTLDAGPVLIVTSLEDAEQRARARRLETRGAAIVEAGDLRAALHALLTHDVSTLLVEGGPTLQASFVEARLADRVHLIVAPHTAGAQGVRWLGADRLPPLAVVHAEARGRDVWIEADVHWNH
jgi:diaminohydroxyphosphoribosylaminopyrimidine deaminase / 5-amino-6-(5-phosphoribosylamino)uracil reductase